MGIACGMKVVIAADSFKGSCSAGQVVAAIKKGVHKVFPEAETVCIPVADGGEGTVDALLAAVGGERVRLTVQDPLGRPIEAEYGVLPDGTAVIETAAASGLPLLRLEERDALHASTFGTGELIRHALKRGARKVILGLGGSATTDGGLGLAQALSISFQDASGKELGAGGAALSALEKIDASGLVPEAAGCEFVLACDVRNKLCGPKGAAAVFGPQKGATPEQVEELDRCLARYGDILLRQFDCDAAQREGSGAAGGLGCAMLAFFNAAIRPGIDLVLDAAGFDRAAASADLVLTGEGRLDAQSAYGKVPAGVAGRAKAAGTAAVVAIGGAIGEGAEALYACGVDEMVSTVDRIVTLEQAMACASESLERCTVRTMRLLRMGMDRNQRQ